ncbi:MAG: helix-turn-helix transcriptional regulator [Bdellovibrionales bacterium]|nr:helix-turn-helix transcriptional regulator [Bdellovibrionales bacterium]
MTLNPLDQKRKYPTWGDFLKTARTARYRSAREFCSKVDVGISYPQYSRYEAGEQLPNLDQALKLCRLLEIPSLEGILEWCFAQIGDPDAAVQVQKFLKQVRSGEAKADPAPSLPAPGAELFAEAKPDSREPMFSRGSEVDEVFTFNRSHLALFESDPAYRDIFTYVNSFTPDWVAIEEISTHLGMTQSRTEAMLENLSDYGVLLLAGGRCRAAKKVFYFPDDQDFFRLRNKNVAFNVQKIMETVSYEDVKARRAFRSVVTRELTAEQLEKVIHGVEYLINRVASLPESGHPDQIFSLCVVLGERFRRQGLPAEDTAPGQGLRLEQKGAPRPQAETGA